MKRAFTLLELLVVLAILAMLTGVAVVHLRVPYEAARLGDALSRVAFIDSQARQLARTSATPCKIVFDVDRHCVYCQKMARDDSRHFEFVLTGSLEITQVKSLQGDVDHGAADVFFSPRGFSPSYCVGFGNGESETRWLFISGLSGQISHPKDESNVNELFAVLQAPRPDLD